MTTPAVPSDPLDFNEASSQLVRDLEHLHDFVGELRLDGSLGLLEEVLARLRTHRFSVAVVGEFRTGKSTFVNALLGEDMVPTDVVPTTATLNRITYGLDKKAAVHFKDGSEKPIATADLKNYVTKQADRALLDSIDEVVLYDNSPYLMNGVDLLDTPGLDDEEAMTAVTVTALRKVDAAILVISALSPLGQHTREFLERNLLTVDLGRVMFLVNRIGQLEDETEADRLIAYVQGEVRTRILGKAQQQFGTDSPQFENYRRKLGNAMVYGMDAKQALRGRAAGDSELTAKSRFPQFDRALKQFLTEDRGALVLQIPVNRARASANEIVLAMNTRTESLKMETTAFEAKFKADCAEIEALRARKQGELAAIDARCDEALAAALPKLKGAEERIVEAVREHVRGMELTNEQMEMDRNVLAQAILRSAMTLRNGLVSQELEAASLEINTLINDAVSKAHDFAGEISATVHKISADFPGADSNVVEDSNSVKELLRSAGGLFAFGGFYEGYKRAGLKGAITGGITGSGAGMLTAALLGMVDAPLLPFAAAIMAANWFGASKAIHFLMPKEEISKFKESVAEKIETQMRSDKMEDRMRELLQQYARGAFNGLRNILQKEAKAVLDNTQQTLDDLQDKHARQEVELEHQSKRYLQISTAVAEIATRANDLNQNLMRRFA